MSSGCAKSVNSNNLDRTNKQGSLLKLCSSLFYCRHFKLRLKRDYMVFSPDLVVENSDGEISFDTTRAYVGHLEGKFNQYKLMFS